jgi:predicted dehydrogenase
MSKDTLPVAVVGVGHLGRHHARIYAGMQGVQLVGVVDADAERARGIAAEYGCEVFDEPGDLPGRVEAASVAVPTEHHRNVAVTLLQGGVDVLIEKPLARTLAEATAINDLAEATGRLVMVGHTERFNPAFIALAGAVREPRFLEVHRLAGFSARSTDIDVVLDLMIHDLDLLLHLDGTEVASVDAVGIQALTDKVDIANARIRMASGCVANLTASRISSEPLRRVRVFQPRAYLSCDTGKRKVERYRLVADAGSEPGIRHDTLPVADEEPLVNELAAFIDAVRSRQAPSIDGRQGQRVLDLALRVGGSIDDSVGS